MDKKYKDNSCENCSRSADELVTVKDIILRHNVEFVCPECFERLEKVKFEEYFDEQE